MDWTTIAEPLGMAAVGIFYGGRIVGRLDALEKSVTRIETRMDAQAKIPLDFGEDSDDDEEEDLTDAA